MANEKKNEKMTKAVAFQMAISALETSTDPKASEAIEKIAKEIENLAKKKSGNGKPTKKQEANSALAEQVAVYMASHPNQMFTVTELVKGVPGLPADMSTQKMTPLLTALVNENKVSKSKDKGKSMYQWVATATADFEDEDEAEFEDEE
jgi:hypothetical protein